MLTESITDHTNNFPEYIKTTELIPYPNKVLIQTYGINHDLLTEATINHVDKLVSEASIIIVERDYPHFQQVEFVTKEVFPDFVFESAWRNGKKVICTDPLPLTNDGKFIDLGLCLSSTVLTTSLGMNLVNKGRNKQLSRRDLLKLSGLIGAVGVFMSTTGGEFVEYLLGYDTTSPHPQITDVLSYYQFRDALMLLGNLALIDRDILSSHQSIIQFIGGLHLDDLRGFISNEQVNRNKISDVLRSNIYFGLYRSNGVEFTARVWEPMQEENTFRVTSYPIEL